MGYLEDKELLERTLNAKHIYGLPVAEDSACDVYYSGQYLSIMAGGMTFNLDYDLVTEAIVKTDVEIHKQYVSSAGGAIGGAMLFGPVGALIGGRVKKKQSSEVKRYLIITYLKDGEVAYLCFDVTRCLSKAKECKKSLDYGINNRSSSSVVDLGSGSVQGVGISTTSKPVKNTNIAQQINEIRQKQEDMEQKKTKSRIGLYFLFFVVALVISIGLDPYRETKKVEENRVQPLFNVMAFIGDDNMPISEQELIGMIGQPNSTEDWVFTASNGLSYNIRTLYYGNYEYKFCKDMLVRISIYEPISYNSVGDFNDMFGVKKNSNSVVNDTGSAYRITNCGINDLWIGYEAGKTQWVHISYAGIFE